MFSEREKNQLIVKSQSFICNQNTLNLFLPKLEVIIVFATSIEPGQPAYLCSLTWLYTVGAYLELQVLILIPLKMIMDSSKNGMWIIPFKKFSRLRLNSIVMIFTTFIMGAVA